MKPSSIAWRIEYRWNGSYLPVSPRRPNSSRVRPFGVAVKAKNDMFACRPRASTSFARRSCTGSGTSSTSDTSAASAAASNDASEAEADDEPPPSTFFISLAESPVWEEWASSMITA